METPKLSTRLIVTGILVAVAIVAATLLYYRTITRPWTRDGQVRAEIIKIATQVSGEVSHVAVVDNQKLKKGELLFQLDPADFELKVKKAEVELEQARQEVKSLEAKVDSAEALIEQRKAQFKYAATEKRRISEAAKTNAVSKARVDQAIAGVDSARASLHAAVADLVQAQQNLGVPGEENVRIRAKKADLKLAKLKLSWTTIDAPSDGYVTNLELQEGAYAFVGIPKLAFVDSTSFWVSGYFKETQLKHINVEDRAIITLMGYPDKPIEGVVASIGRAISTPDTAETSHLLLDVSATFDWVRLAQRIPVRINLTKIPDGVELISGTTASVVILNK